MTIAPREVTVVRTPGASATYALAAAVVGFFVVTLDAVVVNVALPTIGTSLGGGIAGLQWVVDGYTLMFASLLLSSGSLADRIGARQALAVGTGLFVAASAACGAAPTLSLLVAARLVQGSAAAIIMPSSLTLISQAYPEAKRRGRAVAIWAMGGSVASTCGPIAGGLLTMVDWRLIFLINVPVGAIVFWALHHTPASPRRAVPFDGQGLVTGALAMGALTFAVIEAGSAGLSAGRVQLTLGVALVSGIAFVATQRRGDHPMMPLDLFRARTFRIALLTGFAFMVGYYGMPFVLSLFLQGERGLSAFGTGLVFLPMMLVGLGLTPVSARIVERFGARIPISTGLLVMTTGLAALALLPVTTPLWLLSLLMILVGLGGPLTMPPMTAVLLNHLPTFRAGIASGVFNTSRQVGGALAIAVFGALLTNAHPLMPGVRSSLLVAAAVLVVTALVSLRLPEH